MAGLFFGRMTGAKEPGIAGLVYARLGLAALRRYWINFDLLWIVALLATGVIALLGLWIGPAH